MQRGLSAAGFSRLHLQEGRVHGRAFSWLGSCRCWVTPVTEYLEQLSPAIRVSNNAVGGTTSETAARCFGALVDAEADLVFLEFGINDRCADEPPSAGAAFMCQPQVGGLKAPLCRSPTGCRQEPHFLRVLH